MPRRQRCVGFTAYFRKDPRIGEFVSPDYMVTAEQAS